MKRTITFFLSVFMTVGLLSGCGQQTKTVANSKKEPVNITIWYEVDDQSIPDALQKELDKLAPSVVVKVVRKDKMTDALKLVGNDPKSAPDMYFFAHDKIGVYAEMGILAPITDFISKDKLSDYIPMTLNAATYKGKLYQLPIYFETQMFMYNKKLMKEAPKTTDDLLKFMQDNTNNGTYGFVEQHSTSYFAASWIHGFNGFIINDKAEPGLSSQNTIDALTYHKQFIKYQPLDGDYNTMTTLFKQGKAAATINLPALAIQAKQAGIDVGYAAFPTINKTGKPLSPFSGVQGVSVLAVAEKEKKSAITAVLKQLTKPDIGIVMAKVTNDAPANKKCYDNADVKSNEIVMSLKNSADSVVPMPNVPEMDVMWQSTDNLLAAVNKKNGDPKTECQKAQDEALKQIAAMK